MVLFILLNPSTADDKQDDPTIRRCINFAKTWDFDGLLVGNLFSYRTSSPAELKSVKNPIGKLNDYYLTTMNKQSKKIILGWGNHGNYQLRSNAVLQLLNNHSLFCLGKTKLDQPIHPLYLATSSKL